MGDIKGPGARENTNVEGGRVMGGGRGKDGGGSLNRVGSGRKMDNYAAMHNILQSKKA